MIKAECRLCEFVGEVNLRPAKKKAVGRYRRAQTLGDRGAAITGVPCPKCNSHKLRRCI